MRCPPACAWVYKAPVAQVAHGVHGSVLARSCGVRMMSISFLTDAPLGRSRGAEVPSLHKNNYGDNPSRNLRIVAQARSCRRGNKTQRQWIIYLYRIFIINHLILLQSTPEFVSPKAPSTTKIVETSGYAFSNYEIRSEIRDLKTTVNSTCPFLQQTRHIAVSNFLKTCCLLLASALVGPKPCIDMFNTNF